MSPRLHISRSTGFSLIEVLVALAVISAGLLGIAKMQALSLASTTVASMRSLAAVEAASLASAMHADRTYWTSNLPAANAGGIIVAATGKTSAPVITADASLSGAAPDCTSAGGPCGTTQLAAYDLQKWAVELQQVLPAYRATITCSGVSPVSCTITIVWSEKAVALTKQEAQAAAAAGANYLASPIYTLYVEP